jgi:hypothetical protein
MRTIIVRAGLRTRRVACAKDLKFLGGRMMTCQVKNRRDGLSH